MTSMLATVEMYLLKERSEQIRRKPKLYQTIICSGLRRKLGNVCFSKKYNIHILKFGSVEA